MISEARTRKSAFRFTRFSAEQSSFITGLPLAKFREPIVTETLLACGWECGARTAFIKYARSSPHSS